MLVKSGKQKNGNFSGSSSNQACQRWEINPLKTEAYQITEDFKCPMSKGIQKYPMQDKG